jgi:hypothetical protein
LEAYIYPFQNEENRTRRWNKGTVLRRYRHARAQTTHEKEFSVPVEDGVGKPQRSSHVVEKETSGFALECETGLGANERGFAFIRQREGRCDPFINLSDEFWVSSEPDFRLLRGVEGNWRVSHKCDGSYKHAVGRKREDEL